MGNHSYSLNVIPISMPLSHSHSNNTFTITPIPMGIQWEPWYPSRSHSHAVRSEVRMTVI